MILCLGLCLVRGQAGNIISTGGTTTAPIDINAIFAKMLAYYTNLPNIEFTYQRTDGYFHSTSDAKFTYFNGSYKIEEYNDDGSTRSMLIYDGKRYYGMVSPKSVIIASTTQAVGPKDSYWYGDNPIFAPANWIFHDVMTQSNFSLEMLRKTESWQDAIKQISLAPPASIVGNGPVLFTIKSSNMDFQIHALLRDTGLPADMTRQNNPNTWTEWKITKSIDNVEGTPFVLPTEIDVTENTNGNVSLTTIKVDERSIQLLTTPPDAAFFTMPIPDGAKVYNR